MYKSGFTIKKNTQTFHEVVILNKQNLKQFIKHIEKLLGLSCFYCSDNSDDSDEYELFFGEYQELGIIVNSTLTKFSIFTSHVYDEISEHKDDEFKEEIDTSKRTYLGENSFILFLKNKVDKYSVSVWDDGCYMCPGIVVRVGFLNIPYTDDIVVSFYNLIKEYYKEFQNKDILELQKYIAIMICKKYDYLSYNDEHIFLSDDASITFTNQRYICDENVQQHYHGKEYFLFISNSYCYAVKQSEVNIFLEIFNLCELYDELTYAIEGDTLKIVSNNMVFSTSYYLDSNNVYSKIEEMMQVTQLSSFLPFASDKLRDLCCEIYPVIINNTLPIVITEGHTDWKHLKKHWDMMKHEFPNTHFSFFEYDASYNMGSSVLLEMCKSFCKFKTGRKFIFIFDCDEDKIIAQVKGKETCAYKKWGNGVFSFPIPIPNHRADKKSICIEHLYTDEEIKASFKCDDGINRRLYLGCDFDDYGRNIEEGLLCINHKFCGKESIKVIDGTSNSRVVSATSNDTVNYALSKSEFAEKISANSSSESYAAFRQIFEIISEILSNSN